MTMIIQGMKFNIKPTTRKNVKYMEEYFGDPTPELEAMDQYEQYRELLKVITEPADDKADYDKIDIDELDVKQVEQALADFLPNLTRIYLGLTESSA